MLTGPVKAVADANVTLSFVVVTSAAVLIPFVPVIETAPSA
jgi:hypothetical protein